METCNTRSLEPRGEVREGIEGVAGSGLRLGERNLRMLIPFGLSLNRGKPKHAGKKLLQAAGSYESDMTPVLTGRNGWRGYVLKVSTFELQFDHGVSGYFGPIRNGWPGVEQVRQPFVQLGERGHADQHQLILINESEWCVVADRWHRYMRVGCQKGVFVTKPAEVEELGTILVQRAQARLTTLAALRWTWLTLDYLGLTRLWTEDLEIRMSQLKRSAGE